MGRKRKSHTAAVKAQVALAAVKGEVDPILWTKKGHSLATLLPVFRIGNF